MKIALLSPVAWRTPPRQYGPWEQVVATLAEQLVAKGIEVTVFATGNSTPAGKLDYCVETAYAEDSDADAKVNECLHISYAMEKAKNFDLLHNNYDFLPLTYTGLINTPVVTTIHGFSSQKIVPVYKKYNTQSHYVSISNADRNPALNYIATIYNGINMSGFTFKPKPQDYLLFFGRIHPEKGAYEAIQVAKQCKRKLIIAGLVQDNAYYNEKVKPYINGDDIVYAGNVGPEQRNKLLGNASALLHLISFSEPFGLSVAEAMCCGTPVIASNRGSMPELIVNEKTGFLVNTIDDACDAVQKVKDINRTNCYQHALHNFSAEKMADDYINVYRRILHL